MSHRGALVQGYNAQAVVGEGRVILAADVTAQANDSHQLAPMLQRARVNLDTVGHLGRIECVLADGGDWHHDQIAELGADGTLVVLPTHDPHTRQRRRAPLQGPEAERIRTLPDTKPGRALYRRRAELVEPVFAHTKHTRQITRFTRRGLTAVGHEWQLIAATHNLLASATRPLRIATRARGHGRTAQRIANRARSAAAGSAATAQRPPADSAHPKSPPTVPRSPYATAS